MSWIGGSPSPAQTERFLNPLPIVTPPRAGRRNRACTTNGHETNGHEANGQAALLVDPVKRRWYPVIDYSRCTNCMECIDFCLFGVYGVDTLDRILVEAQDNCKRAAPPAAASARRTPSSSRSTSPPASPGRR